MKSTRGSTFATNMRNSFCPMKINILMSTYNGEKFVAEQIESIQKQTFTDWNLLIRDDGSIDKTCEIIDKVLAKDSRI